MTYSGDSIVNYTEFPGGYELMWVEVTPDSASGNITWSDWTNVVPVGVVFTQALASTCLQLYAEQDGTTLNKVNFVLYNSDGGAATSYKTFRVLLLVS